MRKIFRARNFFLFVCVLILGWIAGWLAEFAYRKNNICHLGYHILQSETDAIKQGKTEYFRAKYDPGDTPGYSTTKPERVDWSPTDECCRATRTRNVFGLIVWHVSLHGVTVGEERPRYVSAQLSLSNCGESFRDDSYLDTGPMR
jgi:hypothetical protein